MTGPEGSPQWPDLLPDGGQGPVAEPAEAVRARRRARTVEAALLVAAGFSLVLATLVGTPWVSLLTLPAALLAPGHALLRVAAGRLTAEPWLAWALRVLLSLAVWTLVGAVFAITPGLDPRLTPLLVGPALVLVGLAGPGGASRHPLSADRGPVRATGATGTAGRGPTGQDPRALAGRLVTVAIFGVVAAGSLFAGYRIVTGAPAGPGYVSVALDPPELVAYDRQGRLTPAVEVRNGTGQAVVVALDLRVDGRRLDPVRLGTVPAGGSARAALGQVRMPACWTRLTVTLAAADLPGRAPRPLVLQGPRGDLPTCPTP